MKSQIELKYEATKFFEKVQRKIVWALPRSIVMWACIRVLSHATTGRWSSQVVPELGAMEALERWDNPLAPPPIHHNLIDAHNSIKYTKQLERKQTYQKVIDWSRLPHSIKKGGKDYFLSYGDVDDTVFITYALDTTVISKRDVLMHYNEPTLHACISKAWRNIAENGYKVK